MTIAELHRLIALGEGFYLEFKRKVASPEKIAKTLVAFANTHGGRVLIGVDDDGSISGVESEKETEQAVCHGAEHFCDPPVAIQTHIVSTKQGSDVVVAEIAESPDKPHRWLHRGESLVYIRVGNQSLEAADEVVRSLRSSPVDGEVPLGQNEQRLLRYLDLYTRITLPQYSKLVNISERRAGRSLVELVQAQILRLHTHESAPFYTLADDPATIRR